MWGEKYKLTRLDEDNNDVLYLHGNVYDVEPTTAGDRLAIAPDFNQVDLIAKLAEQFSPPYYLLYVLTVPRWDHEPGRYESPLFEAHETLYNFLKRYREYIETDGRFHLWVGTTDNSGLLVFDHHNIIFAYGPTDKYIRVLEQEGFKKQAFSIPVPHAHNFYPDNDQYEDGIFTDWKWDWMFFPLEEGDEY